MLRMTLDDYVNWAGWVPTFEPVAEGGWRVTVAGLPDFELFADSEQELRSEWKDGLRSHLGAYLKFQKFIPVPEFRLPEESEVSTSSGSLGQVVRLSSDLQDVSTRVPA